MDTITALWLADIARGLVPTAAVVATVSLTFGGIAFVILNHRDESEHVRAAALLACKVLLTVGALSTVLAVLMPSERTFLAIAKAEGN